MLTVAKRMLKEILSHQGSHGFAGHALLEAFSFTPTCRACREEYLLPLYMSQEGM